jgi:hypothetical protein
MHPTRRFPVLALSTSPYAVGYVFVSYGQDLVLRIERAATQLAPPRSPGRTKLTAAALQELVSLARECDVLGDLV